VEEAYIVLPILFIPLAIIILIIIGIICAAYVDGMYYKMRYAEKLKEILILKQKQEKD